MRNIITSLRLISDVDWKQLFERLSLVDVVLPPNSDFESMDFPTRTLYRSAVEELARGSNRTELDIASAAVRGGEASRGRSAGGGAGATREPGYILLAGGRRAFEQADRLSAAHAKLGGAPQPIARRRRLSDGDFRRRRDPSCGAAARPVSCRSGR